MEESIEAEADGHKQRQTEAARDRGQADRGQAARGSQRQRTSRQRQANAQTEADRGRQTDRGAEGQRPRKCCLKEPSLKPVLL